MGMTIRLKSFEIENIKNVKYGCILMPDALKKVPDCEEAGVLGIYGQNGSGKTAVIDALLFLRLLLAGENLPVSFLEYADVSSDTVRFTSVFYLFDEAPSLEITYETILVRAEKGFITGKETLSAKEIGQEIQGRKTVIFAFE